MKNPFVFIDESGIHKQIDHSVFSLVYISMEDRENIENSIINIEKCHKMEFFHWSDLPWKLREKFLLDIENLPFVAKIAIFRNPIRPKEALEWALVHLLVERNFRSLFIEGKKPRWVERELKKVLRDKGISTRKLKTLRHESSAGIRLADALAGLSRSYYDNPLGRAKPLWNRLEKKITTQLLGGQVGG